MHNKKLCSLVSRTHLTNLHSSDYTLAEEKIETNTINLRSIMVNLNLNADQAMDALSIDEKDRDFYREKLASLSKN